MLKAIVFVLLMVGTLFIVNQFFPSLWHTVLYSQTFGKGSDTTQVNLYAAYPVLLLAAYLGSRIKVA